jgi:hypothetical protein
MKTITMDIKAAAWLAIGHLNELIGTTCCPVCCGPCWAIKRLLTDGQLDELVGLRGWAAGSSWWNDTLKQVDRTWLYGIWAHPSECEDQHLPNDEDD